MTKTTTTCDQCGSVITRNKKDVHIKLDETTFYPQCLNGSINNHGDFCSRSCLSEYLKPKTETTP